jgi:hypothetical protein
MKRILLSLIMRPFRGQDVLPFLLSLLHLRESWLLCWFQFLEKSWA